MGLGFTVGAVRVGFAFFGVFFHDVIIQTMGRNGDSKFGCILG